MYNDRFNKLTKKIVDFQFNSVECVECGFSLPNRKVITKLTTNLLELVFPGFFTECKNTVMEEHIPCVLNTTFEQLKVQIKLALLTGDIEKEEAEKKSEEITFEFFERLTDVIEVAHTDVSAAFMGDPAATGRGSIISSYPGIFATTVQRLANLLFKLDVPYIPRLMTEYAHGKTGIDIHPGATIGKYFFIDHGTGVVIGETTIIGDYVKIYQGVTLGAISTKDGQQLKGVKRHPTLKDHVTIYSDASVLGGDTIIYDNVTIAGNAFITSSVEKPSKDVLNFII